MKFFKCKLCAEKDLRITDLKAQLNDLRSLVLPKTLPTHIPLVQVEADAVLNGHEEVMQITSEQDEELRAINDEAVAILTGNYG